MVKERLQSSREVWFAGLLTLSVIVGWKALAGTLILGIKNNEYTHLLLVLPISLTFVLAEWKEVRSFAKTGLRYGSILLASAVLIGIVAVAMSTRSGADVGLSISMLALVIWWIGSFVLCFGTRISRLLMFPLGFLFWIVPLPAAALDRIVELLQRGSAVATVALFNLANVPVMQDGLQLSIPGLTLEIAKECSSIRSSLMLLVTTMVLAQLFLKSPLRKALIVAIALPLSVAKNGLRIFVVAMLGTRVDPTYLTGKFHHQGGIVFFAISLLVVFLLLWGLERGESRAARTPALKALAIS